MRKQKTRAQNILEFTFVFLVIVFLFISIIELALLWRAQNCVTNMANQIVAKTQVEVQNSAPESQMTQTTLKAIKDCAGLLNLSDSEFTITGSNSNYEFRSNRIKNGAPAMIVFLSINNPEKCDISVGVAYTYTGILLFQKGRLITSGPAQSIQKF